MRMELDHDFDIFAFKDDTRHSPSQPGRSLIFQRIAIIHNEIINLRVLDSYFCVICFRLSKIGKISSNASPSTHPRPGTHAWISVYGPYPRCTYPRPYPRSSNARASRSSFTHSSPHPSLLGTYTRAIYTPHAWIFGSYTWR